MKIICLQNAINKNDVTIPQPGMLHLSAANIDRHGAYLMDTGSRMFLWVGAAVSDAYCQEVFDVPNFTAIQDGQVCSKLPSFQVLSFSCAAADRCVCLTSTFFFSHTVRVAGVRK